VFLELFFDPVVELFLGSFFRGQGGLVGELKNAPKIGSKKAPKNGSKSAPKWSENQHKN